MNERSKFTTREKVATAISAIVVITMVIYWVTQVLGVIEMLHLAYG